MTPEYLVCAEVLEDTHCLGHLKPLSTYQRYFKSGWKALVEVPISGRIYATDVAVWTCNCSQQKYHCHHLCKHLVQAVPSPPILFWHQVICHHISPFTTILHLCQKTKTVSQVWRLNMLTLMREVLLMVMTTFGWESGCFQRWRMEGF